LAERLELLATVAKEGKLELNEDPGLLTEEVEE
jgi:hypothetical protein